MVGQGSADEPKARARPGTSEGRDLKLFGRKAGETGPEEVGWSWAGEGGRQEARLRGWEEEQERGEEEFSVRHCKCGEP